jgi:hypothetical protein
MIVKVISPLEMVYKAKKWLQHASCAINGEVDWIIGDML